MSIGGSESVVEQMLLCFPSADIFAVCMDPKASSRIPFLQGRHVHTTFIQRLPNVVKAYRKYLPLMPLAIEQLDLSAYDVIISSSHAVAKGVLTGPDQLHISYVHSPIRYAWDLQHQYLRESDLSHGLKSALARWLLHKIRIWDVRTAAGVDYFVVNSQFIGRRVNKVYRRESTVIYPPVDIDRFECVEIKEDFYLTASRLVPYKRVDLIVEAFNLMPDKTLVVIGSGPELEKIRALAGSNVRILGFQEFADLKSYMQRAKAFVFAAEEDFGITPVEALACGTPVIAFGKGGALETVVGYRNSEEGSTGVFFSEQTADSLRSAVAEFERVRAQISSFACRLQAEKFSAAHFREKFGSFVNDAFRKWKF